MANMDKTFNFKDEESRVYGLWEKLGYFNPDNLAGERKETFVIVVPPPNVTGSLHMGHALNAVIQDILIRRKRMQGYKTLWVPGTDHAGIATQNVVEKELKKQGVSRRDLGREKFLEKVWEWKEKYGGIILDQLKKLGASLDWSRTRFTMDEDYQKAVIEAFRFYFDKGWIYRAERVINWCPRCQTSLSDLELEHKEEKGKLWYIKYSIVVPTLRLRGDDEYIIVATTRPETMLGDAAVAVNPNDERYKKIIGEKVILPIQNREIPIIAEKEIDMNFGTGAVKVTPAHDLFDSRIGEKNNLPLYKVIGQNGLMTQEAGELCAGLKIKECREKVLEELKKQGLIIKEEDYVHNVAICYRCGTVVEPLPSLQWFLKMDELAKLAIEAVKSGAVVFHPKNWEKVYLDWFNNIQDWNISRQIWWGHQLPVYFCVKNKQEAISNFKFPISKNNTEDFIVSDRKPEKCPICGECEMIQETDVLDTWFSSALWPFATLGWPFDFAQGKPRKGSDLEIFYPTQVLSTARDIINLWVARMIFSGIALTGEKPFSDVIIHGTVLAKDGRRMSKSLGTGIDPMILIEKYGADATRFGLIWQAMGGQDIHWDESAVVAGGKFVTKLWNIARFILQKAGDMNKQQITDLPELLEQEDKNIILKFQQTKESVDQCINDYQFGQALHELYDFIWHDFADAYIEQSKKRDDETAQKILFHILTEILKILHPFMPFATEAIWEKMPGKKDLLIVETL